jgi:putative transposase
MPRKKIIRQNEFPYHVVCRSNNRDWFQIPMENVWEIVNIGLEYSNKKVEVKIHAFVLMNNHFHMILTTPSSNIDKFMQIFNRFLSLKFATASNRINRKFGGPYSWTIINTQLYLYNATRYIFQNPLRAKLTLRVENYPFSTLFYQVNELKHQLRFTIDDLLLLNFNKDESILPWLNEKFSDDQVDTIKRSLKHGIFEIKSNRNSKKRPTFNTPENLSK